MRPGLLSGLASLPVIPTLRVSITSGVAPLGVVVDGVQSENANWRDHLFFFDFGDGSAGTYTYGARPGASKGKHAGMPVSAYCYETPGSYTIRMWVYDGARVWGPVSQAITVTDPDTVYSGASTICFSTSGDFTGAPAGATQTTTSNWNTVLTAATSGKRILLRAGEVWTQSTAQTLSGGRSDLYVGSFGTGAKPIVRAAAASVVALQGLANGSNPANNAKRWRVRGVRFESGGFASVGGIYTGIIAPAAGVIPLNPSSADGWFTVHDCEFSGVYFPLYMQGRGNVVSKTTTDTLNNGVASSGACSWFVTDAYQCGIIDCNFDNGHGSEHVFRLQGGKLCPVQGVTFAKPAAAKHFAAFRGAATYTSDYNGLSYCKVDGSATSTAVAWMVQVAPNANTALEYVDRNWCDGSLLIANDQAQTGVIIEATNIEVRNSVMRVPASSTATGCRMVQTINANTAGSPDPANVRVLGCSAHYLSSVGFSLVVNASGSTGLQARANIAYAPSATKDGNNTGSAPSLIVDQNGDAALSGNSSDSQVKSTDPLWSSPGSTIAGYVLGASSPYINAGSASAGLINEAQGYLRNSSGYDMGAVNSAAKATDAWTLIPA